MWPAVVYLWTLALWTAGTDGARGTYLITAPSTMYRGSSYDVTVDILEATQGVDTEVAVSLLRTVYNSTTFRQDLVEVTNTSLTVSQGSTGRLTLPIDRDLQCPGCRLQIRSQGGLQLDQSLRLVLSSSVVALLVQTDKAIYKPAQTVRYRAVAVYPTLQIYNGSFNVIVQDPRGNKVQYLRDLTSRSGVVEGSLNLSDQPLFGDWSITVSLDRLGDTQIQKFTVADYELPRFEVSVDLDPYGLLSQVRLTGKVKAKYTFGQPVEGMVELHVGPNVGRDTCGNLPDTVQTSFAIDGEAEFTLPIEDVRRALGYLGDGYEVKVTAFVKEAATGVRLNGSSVVKYHQNEYNIKVLDNTPSVFKPGLPYTAYFQVSTPDAMPPRAGLNRLVNVYTTAHYKVQVPDQDLYGTWEFTGTFPLAGQNLTLPASGILAVDIAIPANATKISIKATFGNVSTSKDIENAYSPGNTFLQLTLVASNVRANRPVTFTLKGTEPLNAVSYMVLSRGAIVSSGTVHGDGQSEFTFDLEVTHAMAPTAHVLVYYTKDQQEVVADSLAFNVEGIFQNEVAVTFSQNSSEPANNITLAVRADPESTVCVLAVDQSVLLLKSGNDITADKVSAEVSRFDNGKKPSSSDFALSYSSRATLDVFRSVGLSVLSDVPLTAPSRRHYGSRRRYGSRRGGNRYFSPSMDSDLEMAGIPGPPTLVDMEVSSADAEPALAQVERIRKVFPEAWLWSSGVAGPDGQARFSTSVPDTITSWVASAFATNPVTGLGVAPSTAKLQVFRPFFVSLSYPGSVVRGEVLVLQATVFNYLADTATVRVTLKASSRYSYQEVVSTGTVTLPNGDVYKDIRVSPEEQGVVYFPIAPTELGPATLEVIAQSARAADAVHRTIYVKPEGAAVSYNNPVFVVNDAPNEQFTDTVSLTLPTSVVQGSATARVKVTGDLVGGSLASLTSLLALPTGCGEQSMVKFAPDLSIYRYLQATGQMTEHYRALIKGYLESGYQRQLTYQRFDGGFSAFGNRDSAGSTWLTAFVVRTLVQARGVIYVDRQMVKRGLRWLVQRQNVDGSFRDFGNVLDRSIQGRSDRPALTAYVLLALIQGRQIIRNGQVRACETRRQNGTTPRGYDHEICRYLNATRSAQRYLESQVASVNDQYSLAVISLALSKASSQASWEAFRKLQELGRTAGALEYWSDNATTPSTPQPPRIHPWRSVYLPSWKPPRVQARPLDILITSYAILTYVEQGQLAAAFPAVTWLVKQKNANGGFVSSQDTSVALEALATYASSVIRPNTNMEVKVRSQGSTNELEFNLRRSNALTLQIQELSQSLPSQVNLEVTGAGMALVEFDVMFHVTEELSTSSFDVSTVLLDDDLDKFNLMICTKWLWNRQTGMVVQEVSIPSGFEPDLHSMEDVAGMKKAERKGDVVQVYFDEITRTSLCYSVMMTRTAKVANTQRNYVRTYDYYSPADQSTVFYCPVKLGEATVCQVCDSCCRRQASVTFDTGAQGMSLRPDPQPLV